MPRLPRRSPGRCPEARQSLIDNLDAVDGARYTDAEQLPCTGVTILYFDLSGPLLLATTRDSR